MPTEKISGTATTGADRAVRRAMLLRTGSALWWRAGASKGLPMSPRMRATFQPDPEVIGMVEDAARAEDAHRSDVEAVEIIGQYVPQPDGNGGKVLRRPADVPDAAARAREAGRVSSTRLPHASIVGYTLHFTCSGITVVCDRCREERELENPPDHALIAVVRDAMLHSERCTG